MLSLLLLSVFKNLFKATKASNGTENSAIIKIIDTALNLLYAGK